MMPIVMAGFVPAIPLIECTARAIGMPGTRPGMTTNH
jgi:hypothetical protein